MNIKLYYNYLVQLITYKARICREYFKRGQYTGAILHDMYLFKPTVFFKNLAFFTITHNPKSYHKIKQYLITRDMQGDITTASTDAKIQHMNNSKHHWQYWVNLAKNGAAKPRPIPDRYIKQMLAEWAVISDESTITLEQYYKLRRLNFIFEIDTRRKIEKLIGVESSIGGSYPPTTTLPLTISGGFGSRVLGPGGVVEMEKAFDMLTDQEINEQFGGEINKLIEDVKKA